VIGRQHPTTLQASVRAATPMRASPLHCRMIICIRSRGAPIAALAAARSHPPGLLRNVELSDLAAPQGAAIFLGLPQCQPRHASRTVV
jgi:hypothetical protein